MSQSSKTPQLGGFDRLHNLDLLRGLAAIIILVWHYQHFYFPEAGVNAVVRTEQPFYHIFAWFYNHGLWAVNFFWILSGYVFYYLYHQRKLEGKSFFIDRFSRLYPLHFLTLIIIFVLQLVSSEVLGYYQIYPFNDGYHFLLHVFMASHWGLEQGHSFNAPIWSVSVEVLAYIGFFFIGRLFGVNVISLTLWFITSAAAYWYGGGLVFKCMMYFSIGGMLFFLTRAMLKLPYYSVFSFFSLLMIAVWVFEPLNLHDRFNFIVLPIMLILAVLLDEKKINLKGLSNVMGDISYSSYLIHVPVQVLVMITLDLLGVARTVADSGTFFIGFICLTLWLAYLIHQKYERRMKVKIREYVSRPRTVVKVAEER